MIKCNVTVCGTISKAAVVRTNNENKAFTAFAVNCVIPARNGIDKTVEISVAKDGEEYNRADYTVGKRVEISGVLTFKKRGDNLYFFQYVGFIGQPYRGFKRGFHQGRNALPWKDRQEHRGEDRQERQEFLAVLRIFRGKGQ